MADLTVSQVAGIIAALIFVVQLFLPVLLGLLVICILKPENNLTTWSVVSRFLHSSYWPNILGSDSVASKSVHKPVLAIVWSRPLMLGLVGIAAIVTPIGLYDAVSLDTAGQHQPFYYAHDESPMGYGTPVRTDLGFNRWCGLSAPLPCIGSSESSLANDSSRNTTEIENDYDFRIPDAIYETYTGGLEDFDASVSSLFDIQWRTYSSDATNNGTRFQIGAYRELDSLVLNDDIDLVEGLVVDTVNGGIGFRNHSAPVQHPHGSTWSEDLLFIEPETACINTNLTLEFDARHGLFDSSFSNTVEDLSLVDRGGFANLPKSAPMLDEDISPANDINLYGRAYRAAWLNNVYTMAFLNVTNLGDDGPNYLDSEVGKHFPLHQAYVGFIARDAFYTKASLGGYLGSLPSKLFNGSLPLNSTTSLAAANYSNPFNVSKDEFEDALIECKGTDGRMRANRSTVAISCGMVFGTPRRIDGTEALLFDPGDRLMMPIYTCASATRASLKTVDFNYNGTGQLAGLSITSMTDKAYEDEESMPLWGVEITNLDVQEANPIWGFIKPSDDNQSDILSLRRNMLYLPGFQRDQYGRPSSNVQNLPGVDFHINAMSMAYAIDPSSRSDYYSGDRDLGIFARWQNLSQSSEKAAKIVNLVWTDVAANAVLGTKGWHNQPETAHGHDEASVLVRNFNRRIHYRWVYGIPAFLVLFLTLLGIAASVLFYFTGRGTSSTVRWYLNATSMGRVYGQFLFPDTALTQLPTDQWIARVGVKKVGVGGVTDVQ